MRTAVKKLIMEREKERQMAEKHRRHHYSYADDDLYGNHRWAEDEEKEEEETAELELKLSDGELMEWAHRLKNADGSNGPRFKLHEFERVASEIGARYHSYELEDLWMTANMLYSDFCLSLLKICPSSREDEMKLYANMAMAFLEDEDSSEKGERKLALYYLCFADC